MPAQSLLQAISSVRRHCLSYLRYSRFVGCRAQSCHSLRHYRRRPVRSLLCVVLLAVRRHIGRHCQPCARQAQRCFEDVIGRTVTGRLFAVAISVECIEAIWRPVFGMKMSVCSLSAMASRRTMCPERCCRHCVSLAVACRIVSTADRLTLMLMGSRFAYRKVRLRGSANKIPYRSSRRSDR